MNPVLFVVLLTAATGVGGLALGGGLAALVKRESPRGQTAQAGGRGEPDDK